jgi:flagellar FliL protein
MAVAEASAKKPGKGGLIITMVVLTLLAVGCGVVVGKLLIARLRPPPPPVPVVAVETPKPYSGETDVKELPPFVTNLANPSQMEVRLQVSIVYAKKAVDNPAILMARVGDDFLAYLKTLSLAQLQGASGLQNLREDLNERAAIRSQGAVREVIIESLVTR